LYKCFQDYKPEPKTRFASLLWHRYVHVCTCV